MAVIEFYGETCPHCVGMRPIVKNAEEKSKLTIEKLEVWNNEKNQAKMKEYEDIISKACGGFAAVPSFVNTDTKQALCGSHNEEDIIALAKGADCSNNVCKPHSKMKT